MILQLREAIPEDLLFAKRLHHSAYLKIIELQFGKWNDAQQDSFFMAKWDHKTTRIIIKDGISVGTISVVDHVDHVFLSEIQISPDFQGQGIGSQLIREQIARASELRLPLRLQVLLKNEKAKFLYERLGFVVFGETDTHFKMQYS